MFTFGPPDQIIRRYDTIPGCRCPIHWSFRSTANRRRSKWKSFAENLCGSASDQSLLKLDYTYGVVESGTLNTAKNNGNIQSQTITVPIVGSSNGFTVVQSYNYDALSRIGDATEMVTPAGSSTATQNWKQDYTFDRYGNHNFDEANRTTIPKNCGTSPNFTVCAADRKVFNPSISASTNRINLDQDADSVNDYAFDAAGNTTRDPQLRKFTYDAENKQVEVKNSSDETIGKYWYDGDGRRVKKLGWINGQWEETRFVYDASSRLVAEYSTIVNPTPQVAYLTSDHLGSPRVNTDENGKVIARHDYRPYGEEVTERTHAEYVGDTIRKQFTQYERDNETDLDFAQARMFGYSLGRFTSPDPLFASGRIENPQTWNRYVYVLNNPLVSVDPTGLWEWGAKAGGSATDEQLQGDLKNKDKKIRRNAERALKFRKNFRNSLRLASQAATSDKLNQEQKSAISRAVNSYGNEGDGNNVIVSFANQGTGIGATTDGKNGDLIFVNFNLNKKGKALAIDIAHEGSHVADNQDFDALVRLDMKGSNLADITHLESERRAYNVTSFIAQSLGVSPVFDFPNDSRYHVWNSGWKEADRDKKRTAGINNLLNDRYSDPWFKTRMSETEIGINPAFIP